MELVSYYYNHDGGDDNDDDDDDDDNNNNNALIVHLLVFLHISVLHLSQSQSRFYNH